MKFLLGQLVESTAGRDRGRIFVVVERIDEKYCKVVDGKLRMIENPKRKNCRHLKPYREIDEEVARLLREGRRPANREIVEAIRRHTKQ